MSPEEAKELFKWIEGQEDRIERYVSSGGRRQAWKCDCPCGCMTEAENEHEAMTKLRRYRNGGNAVCVSTHPTPTGQFMPPIDFN